MTSDETFLPYLGGIHNNDLINIIDINDIESNEPQLIRRRSYYDFDKFSKFAQRNTTCFSILSTYIYIYLIFKFKVTCLQETWKAEKDDFS